MCMTRNKTHFDLGQTTYITGTISHIIIMLPVTSRLPISPLFSSAETFHSTAFLTSIHGIRIIGNIAPILTLA